MRSALNDGREVIALTADISAFYHKLNPGFMLDPDFVSGVMGLDLTPEQAKLNRLFISAVEAWADRTPLENGLPVGLPASAVIANVALVELDRIIEKQVVPLYYGRYVDDILLVMENGVGFSSPEELWEWLFARSAGNLGWVEGGENNEICFKPSYLADMEKKSEIHFANSKNKIFLLSGETGITLVDTIAHQIYERASEWRAMPRLPQLASHVGADLLAATQSDGEVADNLRKADALTMRRASFAIKLRDFEAYERDLPPKSWEGHRRAFFQSFRQHVLVLPHFFDLALYLPRVVRLATVCEDFSDLRGIMNSLDRLCRQVWESCDVRVKACSLGKVNAVAVIDIWERGLLRMVRESIAAAFPPRLSKIGRRDWESYMADFIPKFGFDFESEIHRPVTIKGLQAQQVRLFSFDLAHMPFRFIGLPAEMVAQRGVPAKKSIARWVAGSELLPDNVVKGGKELAKWMKLKGLPHGLLFATRPLNLPELFILNRDACSPSSQAVMNSVVLATRGFDLGEKAPRLDKKGVLQVPNDADSQAYTIAVSSWKTSLDSWASAVARRADPDTERYARLCRLLNELIAQPRRSRYFVLPELSLPVHWFMRIAHKLQSRGISLITGVEYLHGRRSQVRNQVWAALSHSGLGVPSFMVYRQDKQRPALHEGIELQNLAGLELKPGKSWSEPPVIQHGDFRFALLVCSELTNISYRSALRGKVDALFVPEWNQDTETFNALVESAALDIHAYIIQCNDRQYGDSRIRAPFKDSWKRDVLRVKGGITDYCVVGEIDVQALREFQSRYHSPAKPFKPVPDGFQIEYSRKVLPAGE